MNTKTTSSSVDQPEAHVQAPSIVVVDLGKPQSNLAVKRLRKGKGALFTHVDQIVKDLVADGTVKSDAQPIVIVVREFPMPPWLMGDDD